MQIYVPTTIAEDWKRLLAKEYHWKEGRSAMAMALCWEGTKDAGGPPEVRGLLPGVSIFLAIPEYRVDLPPAGGRPSQTDLFALGTSSEGLVAVSVEGKVDESFGPTLEARRSDSSPGVQERIRFLLNLLKLPAEIPGATRYQLLHRSAAAILAAARFRAARALMIVHSFSEEMPQAGFSDFAAFLRLFGKDAKPGELHRIGAFEGVPLDLAWCTGDSRYLKAPGVGAAA
jgi:hypothetical protein